MSTLPPPPPPTSIAIERCVYLTKSIDAAPDQNLARERVLPFRRTDKSAPTVGFDQADEREGRSDHEGLRQNRMVRFRAGTQGDLSTRLRLSNTNSLKELVRNSDTVAHTMGRQVIAPRRAKSGQCGLLGFKMPSMQH